MRHSLLLLVVLLSFPAAAEGFLLSWGPVAQDKAKYADPKTGSFLLPMPQVGAFNLGKEGTSMSAFCTQAAPEAKRQLGLDRFPRRYQGSALEQSPDPVISVGVFREGAWARGGQLPAVLLLLCLPE